MSARWNHMLGILRKASDPATIIRVFADPRKLIPPFKELLFDRKLLPASASEEIAMLRRSVDALAALCEFAGKDIEIAEVSEVFRDAEDSVDALELSSLLTRHGSDKAILGYHAIYSALLAGRRKSELRIMEIGIGTNNIDVPSNMGLAGKPGASLRAFRDWLPHAAIVGADVDKRILFEENRITSFFVDQTRLEVLSQFAASFGMQSFDIIIDDGLHTPEANLNTLYFSLPLIRRNGAVIIEDIDENLASFWKIAFSILGPAYRCRLFRAKSSCVAVVQPVEEIE